MRLCVGAVHAEGCHHEVYMRQGVERFLAHPRTRRALTLALAQERPIHPEQFAVRVLVYLARVNERLEGLDCDTSTVETLTDDELAGLDVWLSEATAPAGVEIR